MSDQDADAEPVEIVTPLAPEQKVRRFGWAEGDVLIVSTDDGFVNEWA